MSTNTEKMFAERLERMTKTRNLEQTDRVPFAPFTGIYPAVLGGATMYDVMIDPRNAIPGYIKFLEEIQPDAALQPVVYYTPALEASRAKFIKWPGYTCGLPHTSSFQVTDNVYMREDEYDEFLQDPSHFNLTKFLPRKLGIAEAFENLSLQYAKEYSIFDFFTSLTNPAVKEALLQGIKTGEHILENNARIGEVIGTFIKCGVPPYLDMIAFAPYDILSDDYRGLVNTVTDMYECPDKVMAAIDYFTEVHMKDLKKQLDAGGHQTCFIPLHGGVDEFMGPDHYEKFYWKGLKKVMDLLISYNVRPLVFCEGNYNTRLEYLADFPKASVEYKFEKVDLKKAKEIVGKTQCIHGNLPTSLLMFGTTEQIADETKKMLEIGAPGGGFIMDAGIVFDEAKPENIEMWRDTTWTYGKY